MSEPRDFGAVRVYLKVLAQVLIPAGLRGRIDPSDIVQETLCDVIENLHRYQGATDAHWKHWLRMILRWRLADRFVLFRREERIKSLDALLEQTSAGIDRFLWASSQSTPEDRAVRNEKDEILRTLFEQLSPAQAEAVMLRHCQGWSVAEISRHMDSKPSAVGGLLKHGMAKLRKLCNGRIEP